MRRVAPDLGPHGTRPGPATVVRPALQEIPRGIVATLGGGVVAKVGEDRPWGRFDHGELVAEASPRDLGQLARPLPDHADHVGAVDVSAHALAWRAGGVDDLVLFPSQIVGRHQDGPIGQMGRPRKRQQAHRPRHRPLPAMPRPSTVVRPLHVQLVSADDEVVGGGVRAVEDRPAHRMRLRAVRRRPHLPADPAGGQIPAAGHNGCEAIVTLAGGGSGPV